MKRSPFLLGFSGSGIPSPGTILKYLGLRQGKKKGRSIDDSAVSDGCTLLPAHLQEPQPFLQLPTSWPGLTHQSGWERAEGEIVLFQIQHSSKPLLKVNTLLTDPRELHSPPQEAKPTWGGSQTFPSLRLLLKQELGATIPCSVESFEDGDKRLTNTGFSGLYRGFPWVRERPSLCPWLRQRPVDLNPSLGSQGNPSLVAACTALPSLIPSFLVTTWGLGRQTHWTMSLIGMLSSRSSRVFTSTVQQVRAWRPEGRMREGFTERHHSHSI